MDAVTLGGTLRQRNGPIALSLRIACAVGLLLCGRVHAASPTAAAIQRAGVLTCGIDQSEAEYSRTEEHGSRVAFDRDLCTAIAAAILGVHPHIRIKGYPDSDTALQALEKNEVDMVATVSDDFSHSTQPGVHLARPVLFDGEGFLVLRSSGITHAADLARRKICFLDGSETELNLRSWLSQRGIPWTPFPFQEEGEMEAAFVTGNCAALAGDQTRLANARAAFGPRTKDYDFLPEIIAPDPLASACRSDDPAFVKIVTWTEDVLLEAEAMHVSRSSVEASIAHDARTARSLDAAEPDGDPLLLRLLGSTQELGKPLDLDAAWPAHVLEEVGNYAEIYDRDLGDGSLLHIPRGPNNLWNAGGLMLPLPLK